MDELEQLRAERDLYRQLAFLSGVEAPDAFLASALDLVTRAAGAAHGYSFLGQVDTPRLELANGSDPRAVRELLSSGILEQAIHSGEVVATDNAEVDPKWASRESVQKKGIEAVLCAPIGSPPLGVITLQGRVGGGPFEDRVAPLVADLVRALEPMAQRILESVDAESDPTRPWRARLEGSEALIGRSRSLARVLEHACLYAPLDKTVLVTGPSGTGKTHLCGLIHRNSARQERAFVVMDGPSLSTELAPAELFGAARGAFTGSVRDTAGAVERADRGTLFLDEVGELKPDVQAQLLRFLQSGEYRRVGESRTRRAKVRVLAATNRDLEAMVASGEFREDLYYRLDQTRIHVPGLDHRPEDILLLAESRLAAFCQAEGWRPLALTPSARRVLMDQDWSVGGVRRLFNLVDLAAIHAHERGADVAAQDLFPGRDEVPSTGPLTWQEATRECQRRVLAEALERNRGNVTAAARELDLDRSYVHRMIARLAPL